MSLQPGARLGRYEIAAPLGAGGMGEVYRGRDTSLDRDVAIKVLPMSTAGLPEARERLSREARALSRLSHPHICAVHDVGDDAGSLFGTPAPLFTLPRDVTWSAYDIAPDGRFLAIVPVQFASRQPLTVLVNWSATLPR